MEENRKKLHEIVDSIQNNGIIEYFITFISLFLEKWGGYPDSTRKGGVE